MNAKSEDVGTFVNMRPYAKDAGDAHETRPYIDTNQRLFEDLNEADMVVDLLNKKIGRGIGNRNRFTGLNMDNWGFQSGDDRTRDNYAPIRFIWEKIKEKMQ